jgi:hypothetical protein
MKRISLLTILCCVIFITCRQQDNPDPKTPFIIEEAFPGRTGELVQIEFGGETITVEVIDGIQVFQGDIIIPPQTKAIAINDPTFYWPKGIVPYTINPSIPNPDVIIQAIEEIQTKTNVVFVERTDESNYIEIKYDSEECWSYVGMIGGRQEIVLADWATKGTVMHEFGHAIGLWHEQSKSNRDDFVTVHTSNIDPKELHNFEKQTNAREDAGFDFNSVMLYDSWAFTIDKNNPEATMTKKDGSTFYANRDSLSAGDIAMINKLYPDHLWQMDITLHLGEKTETYSTTVVLDGYPEYQSGAAYLPGFKFHILGWSESMSWGFRMAIGYYDPSIPDVNGNKSNRCMTFISSIPHFIGTQTFGSIVLSRDCFYGDCACGDADWYGNFSMTKIK